VALIGCGSAGMMFLHAIASRRKRGDDDALFPEVVCFEQAEAPGGAWRDPGDASRGKAHNAACWYEAVWNNVSKEMMEFHDYTYQQHFGRSLPSFLPKRLLMEYFQTRCRSADPDLLDGSKRIGDTRDAGGVRLHEVRYSTVVTSVSYEEETQLFTVSSAPLNPEASKRHIYQPTFTESFDYCVWAAGIRGKPRIPRSILTVLRQGGEKLPFGPGQEEEEEKKGGDSVPTPFSGKIMHSIQCSQPDFLEPVQNKRVLLIGDSSSAEDLALYLCKVGAEKITILSRSGYGDCVYMGCWPGSKTDPQTGDIIPNSSKVDVHVGLPYQVLPDGRSIRCIKTVFNDEDEAFELDPDSRPFTVENVDTIVFCTGFVPNTEFLHESLCYFTGDLHSWYWSVAESFRMKDNPFTPDIGHVEPSPVLDFSGNIVPGIYRTLWIKNPSMMYLVDSESEFPLLTLEAQAWLALAYITGDTPIPSVEEMERGFQEQLMQEMNTAYLRWSMDGNYFEALDNLDENHWSDDYDDPRAEQMNEELYAYYIGVIARDFRASKYDVDLGTYDDLNETGRKFVSIGVETLKLRHLCGEEPGEAEWRTFRDVLDTSKIRSVYTGQEASKLPQCWLEVDDSFTV